MICDFLPLYTKTVLFLLLLFMWIINPNCVVLQVRPCQCAIHLTSVGIAGRCITSGPGHPRRLGVYLMCMAAVVVQRTTSTLKRPAWVCVVPSSNTTSASISFLPTLYTAHHELTTREDNNQINGIWKLRISINVKPSYIGLICSCFSCVRLQPLGGLNAPLEVGVAKLCEGSFNWLTVILWDYSHYQLSYS